MLERHVTVDDVNYLIDFGSMESKAGAVWFFLLKNDIPVADRRRNRAARRRELVVCVTRGCVATVFWNPNPARFVERKRRYYTPKGVMDDAPEDTREALALAA